MPIAEYPLLVVFAGGVVIVKLTEAVPVESVSAVRLKAVASGRVTWKSTREFLTGRVSKVTIA